MVESNDVSRNIRSKTLRKESVSFVVPLNLARVHWWGFVQLASADHIRFLVVDLKELFGVSDRNTISDQMLGAVRVAKSLSPRSK